MPDSEIAKQLREICSLWNETESRVKQAERLRAEVVIPSIKELRYAGRWLVDVLLLILPQVEDKLDEAGRSHLVNCLFEASQNCVRAKNDAIDASVLFVHQRLEQMKDAFGILNVAVWFPDYFAMLHKIKEVDGVITRSRGEERPDRNSLYDDIAKEHLPRIVEIYHSMVASEDAIREAVKLEQKIQEKKEKGDRAKWWISLIVGICGVFVGAILDHFLNHFFY